MASVFAFGLNDPEPEDVQVPAPGATPCAGVTVPVMNTPAASAQMDLSTPALATGGLVILNDLVATALKQLPLPVVVKVNPTDPAVLSAADGK